MGCIEDVKLVHLRIFGRIYTIKRVYLQSICRAKRVCFGSIFDIKRYERDTLQGLRNVKWVHLRYKTCIFRAFLYHETSVFSIYATKLLVFHSICDV